jgi:hypothetical protein
MSKLLIMLLPCFFFFKIQKLAYIDVSGGQMSTNFGGQTNKQGGLLTSILCSTICPRIFSKLSVVIVCPRNWAIKKSVSS